MRLLTRINEYLLFLGIPGLFVISFLDSAAVPLAGGPDAIIVLLAWRNPAMAIFVVLAAAMGSTLGSMVLYGIGKKGGERALRRFNPQRVHRLKGIMEEYGAWAVFAAVVTPPPFPTKPVVLAAGLLQAPRLKFAVVVFTGRFLRYSLLAWLGAKFGDQAAIIIKNHYPEILLSLGGILLLALLFRRFNRRAKTVE